MGYIIRNGRVIDPATQLDGIRDIRIQGNSIQEIGQQLLSMEDEQEIDATGCVIFPGFIDLHVHFRDPGLTEKEDIATGGAAAARGGITTVCTMPNTKPSVDCVETLAYVQEKAKKVSPVRVEQLSAITKAQAGDMLVDMEAMVKQGAIAFSEDGKSVMQINVYAKAMEQAAKLGALIMAHCEDKDLVGKGVLNQGVASERFGVPGITNAVEDIITARDIFLANETGARLHLCHCSTEGSVKLIRMAKEMGIEVTGEVCPHHFVLTDEEITTEDSNYKMNPPLRTKKDVQALIQGLQDGTMDVISTDHAPHTKEEKEKGFVEAPFGIVGLETSASLTYTVLVETGVLSLMEMAEKMSYNPAKIIGIDKERGSIQPGYLADLTIFNPDKEYVIDPEEFASKGKNTPFARKKVKGKVMMTICNGNVVYEA